MEIKIKTKETFRGTRRAYQLARGVFSYLDHEGLEIDYDYDNYTLTIELPNAQYRDTSKLVILQELLEEFDCLADVKQESEDE